MGREEVSEMERKKAKKGPKNLRHGVVLVGEGGKGKYLQTTLQLLERGLYLPSYDVKM